MPASREQRGFGSAGGGRKPRKGSLSQHRVTYEQHVVPLRARGRLEAAEPILNLLAQSQTEHAEVYRDLEVLALARGDKKAADRFRDLWLNNPSELNTGLLDQAITAQSLGCTERAIQFFQLLLNRQPGHPEATLGLAKQLMQQEKFAAARKLLLEMDLEPTNPLSDEARELLAICAVEMMETAAAFELAFDVLRNRQSAEAHAVLAAAFHQHEQEDKAWNHLKKSRDLCADPDHPPWPIPRLLAGICLDQHRLKDADILCRVACHQEPNSARLQRHFGELLLLQGQLTNGFIQLSRCFSDESNQGLHSIRDAKPTPSLIDQDTIHLVANGTLGDTLLFSRYAPWILHHYCKSVHFYVQPPVCNLLRDSYKHGIIVHPMAHLAHRGAGQVMPLLTAPAVFGACDQQPNLSLPCLQPNQQLVETWRRKLNLSDGERLIGINWHGSALRALQERVRSDIPLGAFAELARQPGVRLVSLQKGVGTEQLQTCQFLHRFVHCQEEVSCEYRLDQMAAIISLCEWIVCDDSGPAHLGGSLSRPTLLLLCERSGWRWGAFSNSSPWYPSVRILRKTSHTTWSDLIHQACGVIRAETSGLM